MLRQIMLVTLRCALLGGVASLSDEYIPPVRSSIVQPHFQGANLTFGQAANVAGKAVWAFTGCPPPACNPYSDLVVQLAYESHSGSAPTPVWTTARLSEARAEGCATAFTSSYDNASYILLAGGHNDSSAYVSTVDVFAISTTNASQPPEYVDTMHLSVGRELLGCVTASDKNLSFFAGGKQPHSVPGTPSETNRVDIFNHTDGTFSQAHLSQSRKKVEATRSGDYVLFAGGEIQKNASAGHAGGYGAYSSVVDIFNLRTEEWSTAQLSQPRQYFAVSAVGDFALFAGGFANLPLDGSDVGVGVGVGANVSAGAGERSDVVDIFNSHTQTWSVAHLSQPRSNFDAAAVLNRYAVFGGGTPDRINPRSDVVDIFDAELEQWFTSTLSHPGNPSSGVVGNRAVFQGGSNTDTVDVFEFTNTDTKQ